MTPIMHFGLQEIFCLKPSRRQGMTIVTQRDYDTYNARIRVLEARNAKLEKALNKMINKSNVVTCNYRHGMEVPAEAIDNLYDAQIFAEEAIKEAEG